MVGVDVAGQQKFGRLLTDLHTRLGVTVVVVSHDIRAIAASCDRVLCLARKMHWHASPEGLTPAVLAEVFEHDVSGALGDVHVEAHLADECPGDHVHSHAHEHAHEPGRSVASPPDEPDDASARD
jgi:ABC-type Mn2+/Zn2+ transport system ATPase subunit